MRLADEAVQRIDGILAAAHGQGRATLYEHEVYGILQSIGLGVPRHRFVRDAFAVTPEVLAGVGHTAMVKVVSPGIPHKQKLGGVKRVATTDPLYVQFVLTRMREEVLSHFGGPPAILLTKDPGARQESPHNTCLPRWPASAMVALRMP